MSTRPARLFSSPASTPFAFPRWRILIPLAALGLAIAAPARAEGEMAPPRDLAVAPDPGTTTDEEAAPRFVQDTSDIDENILLPAARAEDEAGEEGDRKWARDYIAVAAGVISSPSYNGSDNRSILPAFYLRGRLGGFAFSTRGTNFQVDLIRQRRGQKTDFKFGPIISLRGDRSGGIKDPQVEALGEKKLAVELGVSAGITHTGVITSNYDQIGLRLVALQDISGRHGSWVASPTIDYGTPLSKRAYVGVSASVNVYGKGFGRHYFDIDPLGSAASGLPVYNRAGTRVTAGKYTFGLAGAYALSGDLRKGFVLLGGAQYGRLTGRYAASPIVAQTGDADQWLAGAGLAYQF